MLIDRGTRQRATDSDVQTGACRAKLSQTKASEDKQTLSQAEFSAKLRVQPAKVSD